VSAMSKHRRPALAKSILEWAAQTQPREGLGRTIACFNGLLASGHGGYLAAE